jgi:hypothetical protein
MKIIHCYHERKTSVIVSHAINIANTVQYRRQLTTSRKSELINDLYDRYAG